MPPSSSWNGPAQDHAARREGSRWVRIAMRERCPAGAVATSLTFDSLQVRSNDFDQIRRAFGLLWIAFKSGIDDVMTDVVLKQFGGQPTDGASDRRDQHQRIGTADFRLQRTLDRVELPFDASNPSNELRLVFDRV